MKHYLSALPFIIATLATPVHAIEFWNSNKVWAGQGQCSAVFTFDSGAMSPIKNLQVAVSALDKSGKKVGGGILQVNSFGDSNATRYAEAFLEGEAICAESLTILVTKATATIDNKRVDLLATKNLSVRSFKPFAIQIGK